MSVFWNYVIEEARATGWIQAVAAITALVSVWLCIGAQLTTWGWGIVSVIAYGVVFWQSKLYANAWLQILYYLPISLYGWRTWLRQGPKHENDLPVMDLSAKAHALCWLAVLPLSALIVFYLKQKTNDPSPLWDGVTTGLAIVAQYMQARKWLPNWYMWIVADAISIGLFYSQRLGLTALIYLVFTLMCLSGYREWARLMQEGKAHA